MDKIYMAWWHLGDFYLPVCFEEMGGELEVNEELYSDRAFERSG